MSLIRRASLVVVCAAAAACSSNPSNSSRIDYAKAAVTVAPLDVPPPLNAAAVGPDGMELPSTVTTPKAAELLPKSGDQVQLVRAGAARWLVVRAPAEDLWPRMHEFLKQQGLEVLKEDARIGLLETQWAENRADIPEGKFRRLISKLAPGLYSANTRDQYRLRLERGAQPGTTEIYLSHVGVEQVTQGESTVWRPRPSDPELVAEMQSRLMLFLGASADTAKQATANGEQAPARARLDGNRLVVNEGYPRTWRLVGLALDRIGLVVEDLDRAKGLYYVRQTEAFALPKGQDEKKGWFSRVFSGSGKPEERRFRLELKGDDNATRVAALSDKGEPLPADVNTVILTRLQEQLR